MGAAALIDLAAILGVVATLAGAASLYAASRHQRLFPPVSSPRRGPWRSAAGTVLLLIGAGGWARSIGVVPALFATLAGAMLAWVLLPYLSVYLSARRRAAAR